MSKNKDWSESGYCVRGSHVYPGTVVLMSKNKDWQAQNQVNVSEEGAMSTHGLVLMSKNKDWQVQNQVNVSEEGARSTQGLLF